jgi:RNA polymerase sigma-B factor
VTRDTGTRLSEDLSVAEDVGTPMAGEFGLPVTEADLAPSKIAHAVPDRARARELFERLKRLPEDDEERLQIRAELVELHLPLVEYLARRFRNRGEWLDDLTQVATIGLIKSIDRFDLDRGVEFSTYATPTIVGEIKRHFRDKGWAVRVPRRLQELKLALTKAISDLAQREGRAPTVAEIAAHLQMSEEEVLEGLESANAYSTVSLDAPDSGDEDAPTVAETMGMLDDALEGVEYRESLKPLLEQLPLREKRILLLRFFGNMTQSQIASELGISQMHVSRLLARTLAQLRDGLTADELAPLAGLASVGAAGPREICLRAGGALPDQCPQAGRRQQGGEARGREHHRGHPPQQAAGLEQVDPHDPDEELGEQSRGAAPPPGPAQAHRHHGKRHHRARTDRSQRDPAGKLVGPASSGVQAGQRGRDGHNGRLGHLHHRGPAQHQRGPWRLPAGVTAGRCALSPV